MPIIVAVESPSPRTIEIMTMINKIVLNKNITTKVVPQHFKQSLTPFHVNGILQHNLSVFVQSIWSVGHSYNYILIRNSLYCIAPNELHISLQQLTVQKLTTKTQNNNDSQKSEITKFQNGRNLCLHVSNNIKATFLGKGAFPKSNSSSDC